MRDHADLASTITHETPNYSAWCESLALLGVVVVRNSLCRFTVGRRRALVGLRKDIVRVLRNCLLNPHWLSKSWVTSNRSSRWHRVQSGSSELPTSPSSTTVSTSCPIAASSPLSDAGMFSSSLSFTRELAPAAAEGLPLRSQPRTRQPREADPQTEKDSLLESHRKGLATTDPGVPLEILCEIHMSFRR